MSKINELYQEITCLNNKIEDNKSNYAKRKYIIEDEIDELIQERSRYGLKGDLSSVGQCNAKIDRLKKELSKDYISDYLSEIEFKKNEIIEIIVEYYNKGKTIDDIIEIEEISSDIYEKWFEFGNFGKNTGYLFVDFDKNKENKWSYSNPINEVKFSSANLNDLKDKIIKKDEVLLIFNENLAEKTNDFDLEVYRKQMNNQLRDLNDSNIENVREIFIDLKKYIGIFNEAQLLYLCEIMVENPKLNKYAEDFNQILDYNIDKLDKNIYLDTYHQIIDNLLKKDDESDLDDLAKNLNFYADKFDEKQLNQLFVLLKTEDEIPIDFCNIFKVYKERFESQLCDEFIQMVLDNKIEKLNDSKLYDFEYKDIINDLRKFEEEFSKKQIIDLKDLILNNKYLFKFSKDLYYILDSNIDKFDENEYIKLCQSIIDICLLNLNEWYSNCNYVTDIFRLLKSFSESFSNEQIKKLCQIVSNKSGLCCFADNFKSILELNQDKINLNFAEIYNNLINSRLTYLKEYDDDNDNAGNIIEDLKEFEDYFDRKQFVRLCNIVIKNSKITGFAFEFDNILEDNYEKYDINVDKVYKNIINNRINAIDNIDNFLIISDILDDFNSFSEWISEKQIKILCMLIKKKQLINNCYIPISLFESNKNKFSKGINSQIIDIIIDYNLYKLDKLYFGYPNAKRILISLKEFAECFTVDQINYLCSIALNNSQVYKCYICTEYLESILNKNKDKLSIEVYKETCLKNNIVVDN